MYDKWLTTAGYGKISTGATKDSFSTETRSEASLVHVKRSEKSGACLHFLMEKRTKNFRKRK